MSWYVDLLLSVPYLLPAARISSTGITVLLVIMYAVEVRNVGLSMFAIKAALASVIFGGYAYMTWTIG